MRHLSLRHCVQIFATTMALGACGSGGGSDSNAVRATPTRGANAPTRTATAASASTRTPTRRAATPTPNRASVCGGNLSSSPRVCNLTAYDAGSRGGVHYATFSYCVADLEGDIDRLCVGVSAGGSTPQVDCSSFAPGRSTINDCFETDPVAIAPNGFFTTWIIGFNVGDAQGHLSNTVTTAFNCCR